jgi:DNA (cytosine-5)-methyltransferase 1
LTHGSLFSGIGGFDLAAEWMGWENKFHCEWNPFGQKVLHYYWPDAEQFTDITKSDFTKYANRIDVLTGGFPCQPYSMAGKRLGKEDDRHLWPEMLRAIREIKPRWVVGENVLGLVNWSEGLVFHEVQTDLENEGYEVQPYLLPAASVNAPHRRDRVWFVAYSNHQRGSTGLGQVQGEDGEVSQRDNDAESCDTGNGDVTYSLPIRLQQCKNRTEMGAGQTKVGKERSQPSNAIKTNGEVQYTTNTQCINLENKWNEQRVLGKKNNGQSPRGFKYGNIQNYWSTFPTSEPTIRNGNDGISDRLDSITFPKWRAESIKAGGNAIVPQVVLNIFKAIEEYDRVANPSQNH